MFTKPGKSSEVLGVPRVSWAVRYLDKPRWRAVQQSNESSKARMSQKCGEWRDQFITTLSLIHSVPVQDKGSKILCVKFEATKIIPSDRLHQEYLTINLGNTSD